MKKAAAYNLYYNSMHKSKRKRTPWNIIHERNELLPKTILNFLPFRIDHYFQNLPKDVGGYTPIQEACLSIFWLSVAKNRFCKMAL